MGDARHERVSDIHRSCPRRLMRVNFRGAMLAFSYLSLWPLTHIVTPACFWRGARGLKESGFPLKACGNDSWGYGHSILWDCTPRLACVGCVSAFIFHGRHSLPLQNSNRIVPPGLQPSATRSAFAALALLISSPWQCRQAEINVPSRSA